MAKMSGGLGNGLRGMIDGLSFYKMKGVEETIVRKSSGHTKEKINSNPDLDLFRREGLEFGGRAKMSKYLMGALTYQKPVADYNIAGPLNSLMKPVQKLDTTGDYSQRSIRLSTYPYLLKGFSLNRQHPFDGVIRYPVTAILNRETISAKVYFPELIPNINFMPPVVHPYYHLRVSIGVVPDIIYNENRYEPVHSGYIDACASYADTEWFSLREGSPALEVDIHHPHLPPDTNFTLVLAVGIRYGILKGINSIESTPYVGSAKVLEVG